MGLLAAHGLGEARIYRERRVAALVPAFNEERHVGGVVTTMPSFVDHIIVVDDASVDGTTEAALAPGDPRVTLIRHEANEGLGASLIDAHLAALNTDAEIMVVMAGDGQMDPAYLPALLDPIVDGHVVFTKGNRFFSTRSWHGMPKHRVLGNIGLTFLTKIATGYWDLFDPQNGYTAIARHASERIDWNDLARDYSFENDVLAHLGLQRAVIRDVDIPARYGDEVSSIRMRRVVRDILRTLGRAFNRRFWLQYVVRSFSPVALFVFTGIPLLVWALVFGVWVAWMSIGPAEASTATVMLVVMPLLVGLQLVLAAFVIDVLNQPR